MVENTNEHCEACGGLILSPNQTYGITLDAICRCPRTPLPTIDETKPFFAGLNSWRTQADGIF